MRTRPTPLPADVDYPPAPWDMTGQLWLSLFRVRAGDHPDREPGIYGAAMVSYEEPSPLTYGELLVARTATASTVGKAVTVTDIWVDSPASMAGGRELWAVPKNLCDFDLRTERSGPITRARWTTGVDGQPIASAWFADVSRFAPRVPFKGRTWQRREDGPDAGAEVTATLTGSSRTLPCRGTWSFAADGPLGWLHGKRPIASFRMADFAMSFG